MKISKSFHPFAALTTLLWSFSYVWTRVALRYFSALSVGFLRYAIASVMLLALCLITRMPLPRRRDLPWFAASGVAGFFLYMIVFNIGTSYVSAATSSVVIASAPVFTALLAAAVFREGLRAHQWAAIAVEFGGILVLTLVGAQFTTNVGVLWLLAASLLLSSYNLLQRRLTRSYSGLQATTYSIFFGTVLLAVFAPRAVAELRGAPVVPLLCVVLMGVFSSALAYIFWSKAFERAKRTSQVSNYMFFTPFLSGIFGFLLIGEVPELSTVVGGALIVAGAMLFNRDNLRRQKAEAE